ncbi:uncharacterized protein LOC144440335 [Glandiceps talaboti]
MAESNIQNEGDDDTSSARSPCEPKTASTYRGFFGLLGTKHSRRIKRHDIAYDEYRSDLPQSPASSTRSSSPSSMSVDSASNMFGDLEDLCRSPVTHCPLPCPFRMRSGRRLSSSMWTFDHVDFLKWKLGSLQVPSYHDLTPSPNLPGSLYNQFMLEKNVLGPITEWLYGDGRSGMDVLKTVHVSNDEKARIRHTLEDLVMSKIVAEVCKSTAGIAIKDLTVQNLEDMIMGIGGVPAGMDWQLCNLIQKWLTICQDENLPEVDLGDFLEMVMDTILNEEDNLKRYKDYAIKTDKKTERKFRMCHLKNPVRCDVELKIFIGGNKGNRHCKENWRVLAVSENKLSEISMDRAYPQLVCQFSTIAEESRFQTDNHYIVYGISICGTKGILLSRAHVNKEITSRSNNCLLDKPIFGRSYLIVRPNSFNSAGSYSSFEENIYPLLVMYMAVRSLMLLHKVIPLH